jgi:hypothetical protein
VVVRDLVGGERKAGANEKAKAATTWPTPPANRTRVLFTFQDEVDVVRWSAVYKPRQGTWTDANIAETAVMLLS